MDDESTIAVLSALAQPTRLAAFRLLTSSEPNGVAAGELARLLAVPPNTLSAHLAILAHAGIVTSTKHSRSIVYRADLARLRGVIVHLMNDCCGGRPELCVPLIAELQPDCQTKDCTCA